MATPDEVKLQKGTVAPTQPEQTGSAKAVSLIESLAAVHLVYLKVQLLIHSYNKRQHQNY